MTTQDYQRKRALLHGYEAMLKNPGYIELRAKIGEELANCLRGLRNRNLSVEARQEFLEGADLAERLLAYPEERVKALTKETTLSQAELDALREEFDPEPGQP